MAFNCYEMLTSTDARGYLVVVLNEAGIFGYKVGPFNLQSLLLMIKIDRRSALIYH